MEQLGNMIPWGGLVILLISGIVAVKVLEVKKVSHKTCEDRRKDVNKELRLSIEKFDKFKEEQSKEHTIISVSQAEQNGKLDNILDKLNNLSGG